jgi:CelD/BcsL family acetyltransferase involved in cellulose biosynthesis
LSPSRPPVTIVCEEVTNSDEFGVMRKEWNDLVARCERPVHALRHEWLAAWWQGFGQSRDLRVLLAREGDEVIGVAPFMRSRQTLAGLPVRAMSFLGSSIDFPDFAIVRHPRECLDAFLSGALDGGSDVVLVKGIPADGDHDEMLRDLLAEREASYGTRVHQEVFIDTSDGLAAYTEGRSSKFWRNIRNRMKRLEQLAPVSFERYRYPLQCDLVLSAMSDLSRRSWKGDAGSAIGYRQTYQRFFQSLYERLADSQDVDVWLLRSGQTVIAYRFGFVDRGVFVESDVAYDKTFRAYSPGTLLAAHSNEVLIREGVSEINLGLDFPWKSEWNAQRRPLLEFLIFPPGRLYPRLVRLWQKLTDRFR